MSNILESKIKELDKSSDYECWYLVKQPTDFANICYLVSFLEEYMTNEQNKDNFSLQQYIDKRAEETNNMLGKSKISKNYRALRVAAFFGLIKMTDSKYENAILTETFLEIKAITNAQFENIDLYQNIITRQIEKMFVSSPVDEEYGGIRKNYRLYPVILLYKVLVELGMTCNSYSVSIIEYRYLVATTEKYEDYLKTLLEIVELRQNPEYNNKLDSYRSKFDNRLNQALKQLDTLEITQENIQIKSEKIKEIQRKVFAFESSSLQYDEYGYINFLGSTESLFNLSDQENQNKDVEQTGSTIVQKVDKPHQRIFFGAPGTGKSFQLEKQARKYFGNNYERVTFHPNYMYGNFVGAYKPFPKILKDEDGNDLTDEHGNNKESITYQYVEGVFMRSLVKALKDPNINYLLVIEEINRANVAAVFGDIFQLLDRNGDGKSEYNIATSKELQDFLRKELAEVDLDTMVQSELGDNFNSLFLPSNFYIWTTMNSADQGVMPMDTAFRRRWEFTYLGINEAVDQSFENYWIRVSENEIAKWDDFRRAVNKKLSACRIPEDKLIGPYFISKSVLETEDIDKLTSIVRDKVLMYLYEDAAKAHRNTIFAEGQHDTFSLVCENFMKNAKSLFKGNLEFTTREIEKDNEDIDGIRIEENTEE